MHPMPPVLIRGHQAVKKLTKRFARGKFLAFCPRILACSV